MPSPKQFLDNLAATIKEALAGWPEWKPRCIHCCDTGFLDWQSEEPKEPCNHCLVYAQTRTFPIIGHKREG
jgi:hypothetical protein